jgi:hypothetical protein
MAEKDGIRNLLSMDKSINQLLAFYEHRGTSFTKGGFVHQLKVMQID